MRRADLSDIFLNRISLCKTMRVTICRAPALIGFSPAASCPCSPLVGVWQQAILTVPDASLALGSLDRRHRAYLFLATKVMIR